MTLVPLLICTACYIVTSIGFYREGQIGMSIAFAGYSLGNIGFLYICVFGSK
jgi:hypothetical protein